MSYDGLRWEIKEWIQSFYEGTQRFEELGDRRKIVKADIREMSFENGWSRKLTQDRIQKHILLLTVLKF
jgi:hypothetical protein